VTPEQARPVFKVQRIGASQRPLRTLALVVSGLLLLVIGYWAGGYDVSPSLSAGLVRAGVEDRRAELERQVEQLTAQLVIVERSAQVAELATEQVRLELILRQDELRALRSEVAFYRSILTERGGAPGPRLHSFDMDPEAGRLKLVLVQGQPDGEVVEGHLEVRLVAPGAAAVGEQGLFKSLAPVARTAYAFEIFQRIELPLGLYQPGGTMLITLLPEGDGGKPLHYLRTWPDKPGISSLQG
jgi:hypothetical protein